ncbi:unnamed protein product [Rotaria sp. Silwood1]|nr:unnamed protein product [Rotaria sp. Silwood1]CAF1054693.1 unnamed protein product [Rotaria sp. Silwood1]CAF3435668.1 unnamed protein product [Rotaria sp. Silwood1]CAF4670720.1 unnamed protein product [Rotaria sp. Silwood1]
MSKNELMKNSSAVANDFSSVDSVHQRACLTLDRSDCLRLIRFPVKIINIIRQAILDSWPRGLKNETEYAGSYEFKFRGNPWLGHGAAAVESRAMMMSIISALYHEGWHLTTATYVSKRQQDNDSLIFCLDVPPPLTSFFAVSFNERDKLRLIGAPYDLISVVRETIGTKDIEREEWIYSEAAYQFKLRNHPWTAIGYEMIAIRMKLLDLLDCFASFGWALHASINLSTDHDGCHIDTWFFRQSSQ